MTHPIQARAERELTGHKDGTFLVRASESEKGQFSISVCAHGAVRHIRILQLPGGAYSRRARGGG